ncbi:MAG: DUF3365 domain-containing protein [Halioglobus sp.]
MLRLSKQSIVLLVALVTVGANAGEADPSVGAELLVPFKRDLQQALKSGLAQGPEAAIGVCKLEAPEIAGALSVNGVRIGRTSRRLRNPANVGPEWVEPILDSYMLNVSDRQPRTVSIASNRSGYAEPITVQPICLTCHGANLAPEISSQLREAYPQDRATGYKAGELRGIFWVEFSDSPRPKADS